MRTVISTVALLSCTLMPAAGTAQSVGDAMGMQIANNGAPNGVSACAGCHGAKGEGNAAANFPRIAGQPKAYLARQLNGYANGSRNNAIMAPIAKALTPQQIDAVAAYYSSLAAPPATPAATASGQAQKRGQALATVGDDKLGIQGCANCHGTGGSGEAPKFPYLAGQHRSYLASALAEWKSGARTTDPSMQMSLIAKRLSDSDIAALADYYATLPPPQQQRGNAPGARTQAGSGQGEATSGGSQGAGTGAASGTPKGNMR